MTPTEAIDLVDCLAGRGENVVWYSDCRQWAVTEHGGQFYAIDPGGRCISVFDTLDDAIVNGVEVDQDRDDEDEPLPLLADLVTLMQRRIADDTTTGEEVRAAVAELYRITFHTPGADLNAERPLRTVEDVAKLN